MRFSSRDNHEAVCVFLCQLTRSDVFCTSVIVAGLFAKLTEAPVRSRSALLGHCTVDSRMNGSPIPNPYCGYDESFRGRSCTVQCQPAGTQLVPALPVCTIDEHLRSCRKSKGKQLSLLSENGWGSSSLQRECLPNARRLNASWCNGARIAHSTRSLQASKTQERVNFQKVDCAVHDAGLLLPRATHACQLPKRPRTSNASETLQ
jgi:hypothetical protein